MPGTFDEIFAGREGVRFLRVQWVDYTGMVRLRILPISAVKKKLLKGWDIGITNAALSVLHDDTPLPEMLATGMYGLAPAWSSLRTLTSGPTKYGSQHASVMCDLTVDGAGASLCPRTALKKAVATAHDIHGIQLLVGFETEVIFMDRLPDGSLVPEIQNAHSWSTASALIPKRLSLLEEIADNIESAGIELEMLHTEAADGQFEFSTGPLDAVAAVDALYQTRQIIETTALRHGVRATFHPAPLHYQPGTSSHMHFSVSDKEKEQSFAAGVMQHLKALAVLGMSSPASYGRVNDNMWACGTWVCWGDENREVPLRRVSASRTPHWELRCVDATANAYLCLAAVIYAGLLGVESKSVLPQGCSRELHLFSKLPSILISLENPANLSDEERTAYRMLEKLPKSLGEGLEYLKKDTSLQEKLGEEIVGKFLRLKAQELEKINAMSAETRWRWEVERF